MGERFFDRVVGIGAGLLGVALLGAAVAHLGAPVAGTSSAMVPVAIAPMAPAALAGAVHAGASPTPIHVAVVRTEPVHAAIAKAVRQRITRRIVVKRPVAPARIAVSVPLKRTISRPSVAVVARTAAVVALAPSRPASRARPARLRKRTAPRPAIVPVAVAPPAIVAVTVPAKVRHLHAQSLPEPPVGYNPNPSLVTTNPASISAVVPVDASDASEPAVSLPKHSR